MSRAEQFAALSAPIQGQLLELARCAMGMDAVERYGAWRLLSTYAGNIALEGHDALLEAGQMVATCLAIVNLVDETTSPAEGVA